MSYTLTLIISACVLMIGIFVKDTLRQKKEKEKMIVDQRRSLQIALKKWEGVYNEK